jgi:2'-5' RNA ligase
MDDKDKQVRWVPPELWHVTVQYLGELSALQKTAVVEFLKNWRTPAEWQAMELRLHGVGGFPEPDHARVLWLGVNKNQSLLSAQSVLASSLRELALPCDEREYNPHLTVARFRNPLNATDLVQLGGRKHFGDYKVEELILLESVLQGHMVKYVPLYRKKI